MAKKAPAKIILRASFRFVANYWFGIQWSYPLGEPLVVHSPRNRFWLNAFYDPGEPGDLDRRPDVVFLGYLVDSPPSEVLEILRDPRKLPRGVRQNDLRTFPPDYVQYLGDVAARISKLSTDTYDLLLWRHKIIDGPPSLTIHPFDLHWAELPPKSGTVARDPLEWHSMPSGAYWAEIIDHLGHLLDIRPEVGPELTDLLEAGIEAPLGHVLFREAWRLREGNLRSALVMGVAAAESAVKEFISKAAPDTSWLIENLPSPPLLKLIANYLPKLPSKAEGFQTVPPVKKGIRSTLDKAITERNHLVHGRAVELNPEYIEVFLGFVLELLYFLDYHAGFEWEREKGIYSNALDRERAKREALE